jgi:hypothetical protein
LPFGWVEAVLEDLEHGPTLTPFLGDYSSILCACL